MTKKILLLGSGELGKEFVIAAKRLGQYVVACDSYAGAPAMQVADACEVFDMLDGDRLEAVVAKHDPDINFWSNILSSKLLPASNRCSGYHGQNGSYVSYACWCISCNHH